MANVLLLMSDEHNPFFSSLHGNSVLNTPNMERLAERGCLFRNAYCPSPLCMPSRSAFATGKRVHQIQVYNNCTANLRSTYRSYGSLLREQGVYTVHAGKSHVYERIENMGLSKTLKPRETRNYPGDTEIGRNPLSIRHGASRRANAYGVREDAFKADTDVVDGALEWLMRQAPGLETPWMLAVNLQKPHFPLYATREHWERCRGELPSFGKECPSASHPYALDLRKHFETDGFTDEQVKNLRRGYKGCVSFVDEQLGRLAAALDEIGQTASTNVIYASDHGEMLGKFGLWWKCTLYEDAVRIPLIASGPDFPTGAVVDTPVDLLDLNASIFASVGARRPEDLSGSPLQEIPRNDRQRAVFSEYHGHGTRAGSFMIRKGNWKLIHYSAGPNQLFDLESDPDEQHNLISVNPKMAGKLGGELEKICSPDVEEARADDFIGEQLRIVKALAHR
jgi:choline-sulfatase